MIHRLRLRSCLALFIGLAASVLCSAAVANEPTQSYQTPTNVQSEVLQSANLDLAALDAAASAVDHLVAEQLDAKGDKPAPQGCGGHGSCCHWEFCPIRPDDILCEDKIVCDGRGYHISAFTGEAIRERSVALAMPPTGCIRYPGDYRPCPRPL